MDEKVNLKLNIPHRSVHWHQACRFCCPVTFSCSEATKNVHASIDYLTGNVFSAIRSDSKMSVLYYESLPDMTQKQLRVECILLFALENKADLKSWEVHYFLSLIVKSRALQENWVEWEQVWPPLNSQREFSVYASVVNWLLSSRQSPTVADIAAPLLAVAWTV